jgi:hypothetical protein
MQARTRTLTAFLLGTLATAAILNFGEALLHGVVLAAQWQAAVALLGRTLDTSMRAWALIVLGNSLQCAALVALGALLTPRFNSTPKAAAVAAAGIWTVGWLGPTLGALSLRLFPVWLWSVMLAAGLVELIFGGLVGLSVYWRCKGTMSESVAPDNVPVRSAV